MTISQKIRDYHGDLAGDEHHRYRSWEHCYRYFQRNPPTELANQRDHAALQLGFYLASWGMYRGSTFLLQYAYTAHLGVIDCLAAPRFGPLWQTEFGADEHDIVLLPTVIAAVGAVREAYAPFGDPTDTLVSRGGTVQFNLNRSLVVCPRFCDIGHGNACPKRTHMLAENLRCPRCSARDAAFRRSPLSLARVVSPTLNLLF